MGKGEDGRERGEERGREGGREGGMKGGREDERHGIDGIDGRERRCEQWGW